MIQLYTLIESANMLRFPELYKALDIEETRFATTRQLNKAIVSHPPNILLAEFIYGFGNNYAGVNVSNLDVSLYTLQRHSPEARVIIFVDKPEYPHLPKLQALFDIHAVLTPPVNRITMRDTLNALGV